MARLKHEGYGTLELNLVAFDMMESNDVIVDKVSFPKGIEVGTIVGIDKVNGLAVKPAEGYLKGMVVNSERTPNQYARGLNQYKVMPDENVTILMMKDGFKFTTNTCGAETMSEGQLDTALKGLKTAPLYASWNADGIIEIKPTPTDIALSVIKYYTMPDGQPGVKFQVINESAFSA